MTQLKVGHTEEGHSYVGGDPSSPQSWLKVGSAEDGHTFLGGDPSSPQNWEPIHVTSTPEEAALQGFGNQAALGYLPQIQAATEPVIQGILDFVGGDKTDQRLQEQGFDVQNLPNKSYVQRRDEYIASGQRMAQEHPTAHFSGSVAGGIAGGAGGGRLIAKAIGTAGRAATVGSRVKDAVAAGAAFGAARNPGDTKGEISPLQIGERATNAAQDALTGAAFQGGAEVVGKVGKAVKDAAKNVRFMSQMKALKSSGAMLKDFRKNLGNKRANELGQTMIDQKLVSVGDTVEDIARKAEDAVKASSTRLDDIYSQADNLLTQGGGTVSDVGHLASQLKKDIATKYAGKAGSSKIVDAVTSTLDEIAQNGPVGFSKMREIRNSVDDLINYSKANQEMAPIQKELLSIRGKLTDEIKAALSALDKQHKTDLLRSFSRENRNISNLIEVAKISKDRVSRINANAAIGLRDTIATGAGATIGTAFGGPVGGLLGTAGGAALSKGMRKYGDAVQAVGMSKVANALDSQSARLGSIGDLLMKAKSSPATLSSVASGSIRRPKNREPYIQSENSDQVNRAPARGRR